MGTRRPDPTVFVDPRPFDTLGARPSPAGARFRDASGDGRARARVRDARVDERGGAVEGGEARGGNRGASAFGSFARLEPNARRDERRRRESRRLRRDRSRDLPRDPRRRRGARLRVENARAGGRAHLGVRGKHAHVRGRSEPARRRRRRDVHVSLGDVSRRLERGERSRAARLVPRRVRAGHGGRARDTRRSSREPGELPERVPVRAP